MWKELIEHPTLVFGNGAPNIMKGLQKFTPGLFLIYSIVSLSKLLAYGVAKSKMHWSNNRFIWLFPAHARLFCQTNQFCYSIFNACKLNLYSNSIMIFWCSSIGMAKAALEAINGCNMFGDKGSSISVIYVDIDAHNRNRSIFETLLPRESSSKVRIQFFLTNLRNYYHKFVQFLC